jgi:hypothetical protein
MTQEQLTAVVRALSSAGLGHLGHQIVVACHIAADCLDSATPPTELIARYGTIATEQITHLGTHYDTDTTGAIF